ncbi:TPA: hypothetical protein ACY38A_001946 [Pasteurella multocida]|nr:hypothetical protein [Pasteurella multocida]HED4455188.1 hypothetical protein [Pasteurella multocida]
MIDFDLIERLRQEIKRSQKEYQTILRQITSLQQQEEKLTRRIAALKELVKNFQHPSWCVSPSHSPRKRVFSQDVSKLIAQVFKQDKSWNTLEQLTKRAIALDKQEGIIYDKAKYAVYTALCRLGKKDWWSVRSLIGD